MKTVLFFYADWCQMCKEMIPILEQFCREKNLSLSLQDSANTLLLKEYDVYSIPTTVYVKDNRVEFSRIGFMNKETLAENIK